MNPILNLIFQRVVQAPRSGRVRYWQVGLAVLAVTVLAEALAQRRRERQNTSRRVYRQQQQVAWAPPGWVFPVAWNSINGVLVYGLTRLLNRPHLRHRNVLLGLQGLIWVLYATYGYVAFRKQSPILSGVWTLADLGVAGTSLALAARSDKAVAWSLVPLTAWLAFASTIALPQALRNPDPLFGTPSLLNRPLSLN